MTNIFIDKTSGRNKRYGITPNFCYYCDKDVYPNGRFLDINDKGAQKTEKGDWKCADCVVEDRRKSLIKTLGSNHSYTKFVVEQEQKKVDEWNSLAKKINNERIMRVKKNRYDNVR